MIYVGAEELNQRYARELNLWMIYDFSSKDLIHIYPLELNQWMIRVKTE